MAAAVFQHNAITTLGSVSTSPPRKHHTVSAGYVRRFALDGEVTVHHQQSGVFERPRGVGYQLDYWGPVTSLKRWRRSSVPSSRMPSASLRIYGIAGP